MAVDVEVHGPVVTTVPAPTALRIGIVGAGAIGCRMAAHFCEAGLAPTLFDGWREHVEAIRHAGLVIEAGGVRASHRPAAFDYAEGVACDSRFDILLVAVRADATSDVLPLVAHLLAPDGCVVSCQNGINEDQIAERVGAARTLGCSMIFGARLTGPGSVLALRGDDTLCIGEMVGRPTARTRAVADLLATCGTVSLTDDLPAYRWKKLVFNCMGNPLTLLTGLVARELHAIERARRVMIGIAREVMTIARACGSEPEPVLGLAPGTWLADGAFENEDLHRALQAHGDFLDQRRFSMWADFEQRGRTEVDALNGYVVRSAGARGIGAPLNAAVVGLVHRLEAGHAVPGRHAIDALFAAIG